jgi:hypothetical protein
MNVKSINMNDKDFVLEQAKQDGYNSLFYANDRLQNDEEVVLAAVNQNGRSLEYASARLKDNEEVVLAAVNQNARSLEYASARLKDDETVVMTAVQNRGYALRFSSDRLKDDYDVVLAAVNQDGTALNYASDRLRRNVNFCIECAKISKESIAYFLGEAKDLFETYNNDIDSVEQQNKANEALLAKISTKQKFVNTTKVFKRKLDV